MTAIRPETGDDEATLEVFLVVSFGDDAGVAVFVLGLLITPLLLVGNNLNQNVENQEARKDEIRDIEC